MKDLERIWRTLDTENFVTARNLAMQLHLSKQSVASLLRILKWGGYLDSKTVNMKYYSWQQTNVYRKIEAPVEEVLKYACLPTIEV